MAADVPQVAKLIDVSNATSELTPEQVERIAALLRGTLGQKRGPVAFVINPSRVGFANAFAEATEADRPMRLFRSIHEARRWLEEQASA